MCVCVVVIVFVSHALLCVRRNPVFGLGSNEFLSAIEGECLPSSQYLNRYVSYFTARGYTAGVNLFSAPYDWRQYPPSLQRTGYYAQLQSMIESAYANNNNTPVVLLGHSMGGPVSLYFLTTVVSAEWKAKYIYAYVPLSGVFGGAGMATQAMLAGFPFVVGNMHLISAQNSLDLCRNMPGLIGLLPWQPPGGPEVVVATIG